MSISLALGLINIIEDIFPKFGTSQVPRLFGILWFGNISNVFNLLSFYVSDLTRLVCTDYQKWRKKKYFLLYNINKSDFLRNFISSNFCSRRWGPHFCLCTLDSVVHPLIDVKHRTSLKSILYIFPTFISTKNMYKM